jgi:hypothetical protein
MIENKGRTSFLIGKDFHFFRLRSVPGNSFPSAQDSTVQFGLFVSKNFAGRVTSLLDAACQPRYSPALNSDSRRPLRGRFDGSEIRS